MRKLLSDLFVVGFCLFCWVAWIAALLNLRQ
jgi:hypothetical protein